MNISKFILILLIITGFLSCRIPNSTVQQETTTTSMVDQPKAVDIRGEKIHYISQGTGDPLIFIHGTVGDYRKWTSRMGPYAKHYHVVAYSRRYAYPNKEVFDKGADYSVRIHADDLYTLVEKLGLKKVHLVGHSYGAFTALTMALDHPDLVASLVLGEPPAVSLLDNSEKGKASLEAFLQDNLGPAAEAFREGRNEDGVELFLKGVMGDDFSLSEVPREVKEGCLDNLSELWGIAMTERFLRLDQTRIQQLNLPVLLLVGDRSPTHLVEISNELHRLLPQSEMVRFENISHGLYFEDPEAVDQAVLDFLDRN